MVDNPKLVPAAYTYINSMTFVCRKTSDAFDELMKKLDKRDPDLFNVYIYNDYFNYAQLDLVDKQLSAIHSKIIKKHWNDAFQLLETLNVFLDQGSLSWPMVDDGERVETTDKVYGACLVTVLRALKGENHLNTEHFPSLETFLRTASTWGVAMSGMGGMGKYYNVLNGIGERLFKDKSPESIALEKARVEEWILTLPPDEQEEMTRFRAEENDDEKKEEWYERQGAAEDYNHKSFVLSKVWKDYKGYLQSCPTKPLRGPPEWDLSKWSEAQRAEFSFDNMDDF